MSLLLDARKKSQGSLTALSSPPSEVGLSLEPLTNPAAPTVDNSARNLGENLFKAKLPASTLSKPTIHRNLMYGLISTIVLLSVGSGYVWYSISDQAQQPLRTISSSTPSSMSPAPTSQDKQPQNQKISVPTPRVEKALALINNKHDTQLSTNQGGLKGIRKTSAHQAAATSTNKTIKVEPESSESLDPILNRAYIAFRDGKRSEASNLYQELLDKNPQNSDALLGLAALAQQQGEDKIATQYYLHVLNLDPRNAVANAGMSALSNSNNYEGRLKNLLLEQSNSAALHFALGNLYAEQSRWGEAQQSYFNAFALDPKNANLAFNLAISLDHLGQGKIALQHYQRALELDQSNTAQLDHKKISERINELSQ